jgi:hypothetical protein
MPKITEEELNDIWAKNNDDNFMFGIIEQLKEK